MRKISFLKVTAGLLVILMAYQAIDAISFKSVRIGRYRQGIADILAQTETVPSVNRNYWYGDNFVRYYYWTNPWQLGVRAFKDSSGYLHPYMTASSPQREYNEGIVLVAQYLDDEMNTIHRYFRHAPPEIWVDGMPLHDMMLPGDFVAPDSIEFYGGGNAEVMVRSRVNTWIGLTIDSRTLAFSQNHHDQYVIYDRTYTNTGLIEYMDTPVLTDTLRDVYFLRGFRGSETSRYQFGSRYGEYPGDTLRITYNYPARGGYVWDRLGCTGVQEQYWQASRSRYRWREVAPWTFGGSRRLVHFGNAALHIDSTESITLDAVHQPFNHGYTHTESPYLRNNPTNTSPVEKEYLYTAMSLGFNGILDHPVELLLEDLGPDQLGRMPMECHHEIRLHDYSDLYGVEILQELPTGIYMYGVVHYWGAGPWTLPPGKDFRIVFAEVFGGLGITEAQEVNEKWNDGTLTWGDYSYSDYPNGDTPDNILPPEFHVNPPNLWQTPVENTEWRPDSVNWAKANWMHTGKDSLFKNAYAAQWAVRNDYNVPLAPPPPSVEIQSMPGKIVIYWGSDLPSSPGAPFESEDAPGFAGYRVYRSASLNDDMELIADISGSGTYSYEDPEPKRGMAYYYAVTAYDDGTNGADVYRPGGGEVLESGKFINRTALGSHLTRRPVSTVDSFRVVPNPFHIGAYDIQFGLDEPNKIMFLDLPPVCTIRIFSESGDLVKTIEHTNLSGDEAWGILAREHSVTESGQYIVSGVYIAYIETPEGESAYQKFVIIR